VLSVSSPGATGRPIAFSGAASTYPDGEIASYRWDLDGDGLFETDTGPFPQATKTYDAPARIDARLRVVGFDGATDDAVRPLSVLDRTRPQVLAASVAPSVFAVGSRGTVVAAARRGTTFRYRLSERATLRVAFEERSLGRRSGRRCLADSRARRRLPRCIRFVARGALTRRNRPAGAGSLAFSGRVGSRPLKLGRYRTTFTATDPSRNRSVPRRIYFRVVSGAAASIRDISSREPSLDSGSLRFPHLGDCTHDGQPSRHGHSAIRRCASPTRVSNSRYPWRVMPTPPGWPS
jgi:hypothetical protein